jgi:hypothetical protein
MPILVVVRMFRLIFRLPRAFNRSWAYYDPVLSTHGKISWQNKKKRYLFLSVYSSNKISSRFLQKIKFRTKNTGSDFSSTPDCKLEITGSGSIPSSISEV